MKPVVEYTDIKFIITIQSHDKFSAISELALVFKDTDMCTDIDELIKALEEREKIMSTGIGFGIAIPHAKIRAVKEITFAIGISRDGLDFDSMDGKPVHLILLVAAGERQHKEYLKILSSLMSILKKDIVKDSIINADSADEILSILKAHQ